jgi:hypothetical protein
MQIGVYYNKSDARALVNKQTAQKMIDDGHSVVAYGNDLNVHDLPDTVRNFTEGEIESFLAKTQTLLCFRLPRETTINKITGKIIVAAIDGSDEKKIDLLAKNKNTLLDLLSLKKNNEYDLRNKTLNVDAHAAFSKIDELFTHPIGTSGKLLGNFPFAKKTKVTLYYENEFSLELAKLFLLRNCNVCLSTSEVNSIPEDMAKEVEIIPLTGDIKLQHMKNSDIIIATKSITGDIVEFINEQELSFLEGKLLCDFNVANSPVIHKALFGRAEIYSYQGNKFYCPKDLSSQVSATMTPIVAQNFFPYLRVIAMKKLPKSLFSEAWVIKQGKVVKQISRKQNTVGDPFELIADNVQINWENDDINERLEDITDYNVNDFLNN